MAPASRADGAPPPRAVAIVPARLGSTRLARKMLLRGTGRYLFEHTVRNAERCRALRAVWLATDSEEIERAAAEVGVRCLRTSPEHPSGTDRVEEAARLLRRGGELGGDEVIVNVQGDEPELPPGDLERLVGAFADPAVEVATLWAPIQTVEELEAAHAVKVVCDPRGRALYFSRAPIPSRAHPGARASAQDGGEPLGRRHVGVYAFRPAALERFCALEPTPLERAESLEQLRWLESGGRIHCLPVTRPTCGIDTEEDYRSFAGRLAAAGRPTP